MYSVHGVYTTVLYGSSDIYLEKKMTSLCSLRSRKLLSFHQLGVLFNIGVFFILIATLCVCVSLRIQTAMFNWVSYSVKSLS